MSSLTLPDVGASENLVTPASYAAQSLCDFWLVPYENRGSACLVNTQDMSGRRAGLYFQE